MPLPRLERTTKNGIIAYALAPVKADFVGNLFPRCQRTLPRLESIRSFVASPWDSAKLRAR